MTLHEDNAVAHYRHLRQQGIKPSDAIEHTTLRFGIDRRKLMDRVNGLVADPDATQAALARVREYLLDDDRSSNQAAPLLADLYAAVTGEDI